MSAGRQRKAWSKVGLSAELRRFFSDNPDEELTYSDIEIKFGCSPGSARSAVAHLRSVGEPIEAVHLIRRQAGVGGGQGA